MTTNGVLNGVFMTITECLFQVFLVGRCFPMGLSQDPPRPAPKSFLRRGRSPRSLTYARVLWMLLLTLGVTATTGVIHGAPTGRVENFLCSALAPTTQTLYQELTVEFDSRLRVAIGCGMSDLSEAQLITPLPTKSSNSSRPTRAHRVWRGQCNWSQLPRSCSPGTVIRRRGQCLQSGSAGNLQLKHFRCQRTLHLASRTSSC